MKGKGLFKFNLVESEWGRYERVPLSLPVYGRSGKKLNPSARSLLAEIYSFTRTIEVPTKTDLGEILRDKSGEPIMKKVKAGARFTYEKVVEELGRGRSTIAQAFAKLREEELIKKVDRDIDGTEYVYVGEPAGGKYYVYPLYLHTMTIYVNGEYRQLTTVEVHVLGYLMSECASPKNGGDPQRGGGRCKTSYKKLARELQYSVSAIRQAIYNLMKARAVYRPERFKGLNRKKLSRYEVNSGLYLYKKYLKKKANTREEEIKIRTSYYAELREEMQRRAEKYMAIAQRNAVFCNASKQLRGLEFQIAKAECYDPNKLPALEKEKALLHAKKKKALSRMGLTLEEVEGSQCNCELCEDRGLLPNGKWCTCYPSGVPL